MRNSLIGTQWQISPHGQDVGNVDIIRFLLELMLSFCSFRFDTSKPYWKIFNSRYCVTGFWFHLLWSRYLVCVALRWWTQVPIFLTQFARRPCSIPECIQDKLSGVKNTSTRSPLTGKALNYNKRHCSPLHLVPYGTLGLKYYCQCKKTVWVWYYFLLR